MLANTVATFALLGIAWIMALAVLYRPSWQLRPSVGQALLTGILAVEAAICVGLWEIEAASGLATWTPLLVAAGGGALAVGALRRGRTPAEVRSIRHWRAGIAIFAVGAVVANWKRIEAAIPLGRTGVEQDLLANAAGIAGIGAFALLVVAVAPLVAVHRQSWLRRAAVPLGALLILVVPAMMAPAALALDSTCDGVLGDEAEQDWCRSDESVLRVETYTLRSGGWHPEGGPMASYAARVADRVPIDEETWAAGYATGDRVGLRVGRHMQVDGLNPVGFHRSFAHSTDAVGACFEDMEPGRYDVTVKTRDRLLSSVYVEDGNISVDTCVMAAIPGLWPSPGEGTIEVVWLGVDEEIAQR